MNFSIKAKIEQKSWFLFLSVFAIFLLSSINSVNAQEVPSTDSVNALDLNRTQQNSADTIGVACQQGPEVNDANFQVRCDAVAIANGGPDNLRITENAEVANALQIVSPEQTIAPGTQAAKTGAGRLSNVSASISARMHQLRAGLDTVQFAGIDIFDNGMTITEGKSGGAAGDHAMSNLGVWFNGNYNFGSVESTFEQIGFKFDNWGGTFGADYRLADTFIAGAAFTYLGTDSNMANSRGGVDSDSYTGSLYATFYPVDNLYIDAIASYGGSDYDISRHIQYSIVDANVPGGQDIVDTTANGDPEGDQYMFGIGAGYGLQIDALTLSPYARFNYLETKIDSYDESGGDGWGQHFSDQKIRSLTTAVGARANYALSLPFGVATAQLHGEWVHEFKDSSRSFSTFYLGDGNKNVFDIVTAGPDRNYFLVGGALTGGFGNGISAFLSYDALVGHSFVDSHRITAGARLEF